MEPRRDDGDDAWRIRAAMAFGMLPQWSPVVTTGTTANGWSAYSAERALPQWSPVVTTGTTRKIDEQTNGVLAAPQWSPVVTTGTTPGADRCNFAAPAPQWSRRDDGDDDEVTTIPEGFFTAAMEPRRDDGDDLRHAVFGHR